jgi:hypothetical protein
LKDAFHGSARPHAGLASARSRDLLTAVVHPYRGCSKQAPRRGVIRTRPSTPHSSRRAGDRRRDNRRARSGAPTSPFHDLAARYAERVPALVLDVGDAWQGVPCWTGGAQVWAQQTVRRAYELRYDTDVRPAMPNNPIGLKSLIAVAVARAGFADHDTGRNCRPTNERLAALTGLSVRTVQRASLALRLLGVATEVTRGRQRTLHERMASWRMGDRGRGWASVWVLHDSRIRVLSPHLRSGQVSNKTSCKSVLATAPRRSRAGNTGLDKPGRALANRWVADRQSPPWARRYRTGTPWARILAGPAQHGWTPRDINQLIRDWMGTGHWVPDSPHKPIGLLGAILAAHGNLEDRPAALDEAREAEELAAERARVAAQLAERDANRRAQEAGRAALSGPGHQAARRALREIAERTRQRRPDSNPGGATR